MAEHPQNELYEQLCTEYKKLSEKQLKKHVDQVETIRKAKEHEAELDRQFAKRLASIQSDEDEEDSIS